MVKSKKTPEKKTSKKAEPKTKLAMDFLAQYEDELICRHLHMRGGYPSTDVHALTELGSEVLAGFRMFRRASASEKKAILDNPETIQSMKDKTLSEASFSRDRSAMFMLLLLQLDE